MANTRNADQSKSADLAEAKERAHRAESELDDLRRTIARLENAEQETGTAKERAGVDEGAAGSARAEGSEAGGNAAASEDPEEQLRREPMMAHLFDSLAEGKDIGHYGRLVFAMVARHFLSEEELIAWLRKDPNFDEEAAVALLRQVEGRDYNPPKRERIMEWQKEQDFPILPNVDDPDCGNVYRNLKFPQTVYDHIEEYQEGKAAAGQ